MKATIKPLVKIDESYASYVDLKLELYDDSRNVHRMSHYRPVTSHRQAFEKIANSLRVMDKRTYFITGAYGTGKSHLCLMFANYLQTPAGEKPMPEFFEHYAEVDEIAAEELRSKRLKGRYLIALCDWGGRGDFEEIVLRAVDQALRREGFGEDFDTIYLQALKKIQDWETFEQQDDEHRAQFLTRFEDALDHLDPRQTVNQFKKRLQEYDYTALEEFKRIHQNITTAPFTYDKANLLDILTDTLASERFKERYQGLLVLFDEFGDTMEKGNLSPKMFQQFAQLTAETPAQCARLIFVGTGHRALTDYAKAYNAVDFRTASDRIVSVDLTPEGVEDIISAIIKVQTDSPLWKEKIATKATIFDGFLTDCNRLKLFDWLTGPKIRHNIIENIYPLHPMATYALLQLARDIASNNRSVFTFFAGDLGDDHASGSYGEFIETQPIEVNNKLNLYTADRLFDYFSGTLHSDNSELRTTIRDIIKDYENSRRKLNDLSTEDMDAKLLNEDPLVERLLRLMLIYKIIAMPVRLENLNFGLYLTSKAETGELKNRLDQLVAKGAIFFEAEANVYDFLASKSVNLDQRISEYKKETKNQPTNLVSELEAHAPLTKNENFLEAKDFNMTYGEDKRLERRLVRPNDLATESETAQGTLNYFENLEAELDANIRNSSAEGIALYVVCETQEEIERAKNLCARNKSNRIVVAVPRNPIPILDAVMEVKALKAIEDSQEAQNFSTQDMTTLNSRLYGDSNRPGAIEALKNLRDQLINHRDVVWYTKHANALPVDDNKPYDAANRVMEKQYSEYRNRFNHDDFNKLRARVNKSRSTALKEATEKLLDFTEPIIVDTSFAQQRGDRRYLERCLLHNGVLRQEKAEGTKLRCEFEKDREKFVGKIPALADMIEEIESLSGNAKVNVVELLAQYRQPPFGQGPVSLILALACIRRNFGDSIRIKANETDIGDLPLRDFETVINLIEGYYPQAFLSYRPLREEERALANLVYKTFSQIDSAAELDRDVTLHEAYAALKTWWEGLPPVARISSAYSTDDSLDNEFKVTMETMMAKDPHSFLLDDLSTAFGFEAGLAVTTETVDVLKEQLPVVRESIQKTLERIEEQIINAVRELFDAKQHTYSGIMEEITNWYEKLDSNQRDPYAPWQINDSKPLLVHLKTLSNLRETFMEQIPASQDYGLKRVADWITDHTKDYVSRLQQGKEWIEKNHLKVDAPELDFDGKYRQDNNQVAFHDKVVLTIRSKKPGGRIYVAEGMADPLDPNSTRAEFKGEAQLEIREHKTIHYVVQDDDGNWGRVETLKLVNETKKYELDVKQLSMDKDHMVSFVFPQNDDAFAVTLQSLIHFGLKFKVITPEKLAEILTVIIEQNKEA